MTGVQTCALPICANLFFESGIKVSGIFEYSINRNGNTLLLGFSDCIVTLGEEVLFKPVWGMYDMAVGEEITSAYPGPADPEAFDYHFEAPKEFTHKIEHSPKAQYLQALYRKLREAREDVNVKIDVKAFANEILTDFEDEWLLLTELAEYLSDKASDDELQMKISNHLEELKKKDPDLERLIVDAMALLVDYH